MFALFEYPDDFTRDDFPKPQDFFSWFNLVVKCLYCRWSDTVVDVECA